MPYVIVEKCNISDVKKQLEKLKLLNEDERIRKLDKDVFAIPILPSAEHEPDGTSICVRGNLYQYKKKIDARLTLKKKPVDVMKENIEIQMKGKGLWKEELLNEIPSSWVQYGDLMLFGRNCFKDPVWKIGGDDIWQEVCKALRVKRIGRMYGIKSDNFRTPKVELLYGGTDWVNISHGYMRFTWDIRYCMFSPGNATERFRVGRLNCRYETVVDMYAGIGYFTIPFLMRSMAGYVHACEWNPYAVAALRKNLAINKVTNKCYIHFGDNREVCPQYIADRVYLGLIPTCEPGIETACKALKYCCGGILHLHQNVSSWKNPSEDASPPEASSFSPKASSETPGSSAVSVTDISETLTALKIGTAEVLQCLKCQEIEKKFPDDLLDNIRKTFISCDRKRKLKHSGSFTIKGGEELICELPSVEVNWRKKEWFLQAVHFSHTVCSILTRLHKYPWMVSVINMHHVKSYAPHVDHMVYDLKCSPVG